MADNEASQSSSDMEVIVQKCKKKKGGGRVYNKRHYCLYCSKPYAKIARHLDQKHSNEEEVARAFSNPKGSAQRKLQISLIRNYKPRQFYLLPKIHKAPGTWTILNVLPKCRPIVSDRGSVA